MELPEVTWPEVTSVTCPDVTSVTCPVRKYVLRMCNRKLRHIRPSGAIWPEVTKSRDRKWPCPEAALIGSRFCACPAFPRVFFLVVVPWLPDVTEGHLTPFGVPLGVRMRNRKLCNTRSSGSKQCWLGVFSTTSASYNHRKPCILYLAWWLELALVISPFYFHIVSI